MKIFFTILISGFCFFIQAQNDAFKELETKIEALIAVNNWDEIILLAPDLLIEEPEKGDGYYYIGLAFFNMSQMEMANNYLLEAEKLTYPALQTKIDALKANMLATTNESSSVIAAETLENEGKFKEAAVAWQKIWTGNKTNLDYALNAISLYINLKLYPEALLILNDPAVSSDAEAVELIKRLNDTKQMKSINGYNEAMMQGLTFMKQEKFQSAIRQFDEALSFRKSDRDAIDQKNMALDEIAWDEAFAGYTIESFEAYLNGSTLMKYYQEANTNIKKKLMNFGESYARENDIINMEKYFGKYFADFPNGDDIPRAKQVMCDTYYRVGDLYALTKEEYAQKEAIVNYEKARKICKNKPDLPQKIKRATQLAIRYGRPDRFFYTYAYDQRCNIGVSFGTTNNRNFGAYFTARCNSTFFAGSGSNGTVDNTGVVTGGQFSSWGNDWRYINETRTGTFEALIGFTKKLTFPLWIYSGLGFSYNQLAWKMEIYDNLGDYYTTDWVKNSDESKFGLALETGLIVDLNGFHLRTGLKTTNFRDATFTLGVGFSLERKF